MGKARELIGLVFLGIGVAGFVLPVIPGIPLLLAAVAVLGPGHPKIRPWVGRMARRIPLGWKHDCSSR